MFDSHPLAIAITSTEDLSRRGLSTSHGDSPNATPPWLQGSMGGLTSAIAAATARPDGVRTIARLSGRMLKGGGSRDDTAGKSEEEEEFDTGTFCHIDPGVCAAEAAGEQCYYFQTNPEGGTVSFDSVGAAFMPLLQAVTFDTWTDPMFDVMGAYNFWAWTYFIAAAVLGGMFVVNLFLAVIFDEFMRAQVRCESAAAALPSLCPRPFTSYFSHPLSTPCAFNRPSSRPSHPPPTIPRLPVTASPPLSYRAPLHHSMRPPLMPPGSPLLPPTAGGRCRREGSQCGGQLRGGISRARGARCRLEGRGEVVCDRPLSPRGPNARRAA